MAPRHSLRSLPGLAGTLLVVGTATAAGVTGTSSLFYEGWGQPVWRTLGYLAPAGVLMAVGLVAFRWPRAGAGLLVLTGLGAGGRWLTTQLRRGMAPPEVLLLTVVMLAGPILLAALLFLFEARHRRLLRQEGAVPSSRWAARHWRAALLVVVPVAGMATVTFQQLPALLARHDDGQRGARVIGRDGVMLEWAPQGPGWNAREADGEHPSWKTIARHGRLPQDRCTYLNAAGTVLRDAPEGTWRLPTVPEIVWSLTRGGASAGCTWDGRSPHASCGHPPDKETPLWAPDEATIYYWSSQEASAAKAFAVNYTGGISVLPKATRGIGFRCVKTAPVAGRLSEISPPRAGGR